MPKARGQNIVPVERIAAHIYVVRGESVMLDSDLAKLYRVETRTLIQTVKRNLQRFPDDFMFQLTDEEAASLRSRSVISKTGRGGRRYAPYAFTEQGVAMLSSVLKTARAADVNVTIMRTFVRIRRILATNEELARKFAQHDRQIAVLFEHVQKMLAPAPVKKNPIGFIHPKD